MKNKLRISLTILAFCLILGGALAVSGQSKTGGYRSVPVTDQGVKDAVDFALEIKAEELDAEISLEGILKAERQTVAGTNYRLCLKLYIPAKEEETDGETLFIKSVVFRSLNEEYSIKSWNEVKNCRGK